MSPRHAPALSPSRVLRVQQSAERAALRLYLSGPSRQVILDLRGFTALTALAWLASVAGVALVYRGMADDSHFVSGLVCMVLGLALASSAHRGLARKVERECLANGMSARDAHRHARDIVFHLWTRSGQQTHGEARLQGLLKDLPA